MWAITSYYNPAGFTGRRQTYRTFRERLGIPIATVELSYNGRFELTKDDADVLIQISGGAVLWQKERLINLAIASLPAGVDKVAWLDADLLFDRKDWAEETSRQLDTHNLVQVFSEIVDLGPGEIEPTAASRSGPPSGRSLASLVARENVDVPDVIENTALVRARCCGFAWAGRRDLVQRHGLYDAMVIGGGVRALAAAIYGCPEKLCSTYRLNDERRAHYLNWAERFHRAVDGRIGFTDGRVHHIWHGDPKNRKYQERHRWFTEFAFDPATDITVGANGAWHWARPRPDLERFFAEYFMNRAEDG